jgi:hypothetical protein
VNFVLWKLKFTIHQRLFECFAHGNDWLILFIMNDCNELNFYFWLLSLRLICKMWLLFQSVLASHQMTVIDFAQTMGYSHSWVNDSCCHMFHLKLEKSMMMLPRFYCCFKIVLYKTMIIILAHKSLNTAMLSIRKCFFLHSSEHTIFYEGKNICRFFVNYFLLIPSLSSF